MPSIYDMLMGGEADAAQSAQALAAAIRGQRAMGAMGGMAGGGVPGLGKVNDAQALQDQNQLEKAAEARMRYGQEKQTRDALLKQSMAQFASQEKQKQIEMNNLAAMDRARLAAQKDMYAVDSRAQIEAAKEAARQAALDERGPNRKMTANEQQKSMFMDMAHKQLAQARSMGIDFLPNTGVGGTGEMMGGKLREWGFPQTLDDKQLARQAIARSIAEPIVRAETGAAKPESEVRDLAMRYQPLPGESRVEQYRKLRSLVAAVGALRQSMPEWKSAEFAPMQAEFQAWADELEKGGGARPAAGPAAKAASAMERKKGTNGKWYVKTAAGWEPE